MLVDVRWKRKHTSKSSGTSLNAASAMGIDGESREGRVPASEILVVTGNRLEETRRVRGKTRHSPSSMSVPDYYLPG